MSIWDSVEQGNGKRLNFGELDVWTEDQGNWGWVNIILTPFNPDQKIHQKRWATFWNEVRHIFYPSVKELVRKGKLRAVSEIEGKHYVSWVWGEYKNRNQGDVAEKKVAYPKGVSGDEVGEYVLHLAPQIVEIYASKEDAEKAVEEAAQANGNGAVVQPVQDDAAIVAAKAAIPQIVNACGTDMVKLSGSLAHPPLNAFDINSKEVREAVAMMVVQRCGAAVNDEAQAKQTALLAEVNSHFNGDTPYLTADSDEMTWANEQIPF